MKNIGIFLIVFGIAILIFIGYNFLKDRNRIISPVPEERGVKVIFITPSK